MRKLLVVACAVTSLSCTQKPVEVAPPPPPALKVLTNPAPQMPEGHPALGSLSIASRGPRRMSVDQLERSLDQLADLPAGTVKLPPDLAVTLGRPDYKRLTEEQLQPSPLFMKFMLDLSAIYCSNVAQFEPTRPAADKFFTRFTTVDENLRFLVLRFTGLEGDDATPYVTRLQAVYTAGSQAALSLAGYQAVCSALFTSPEFLLY